jgi:DNA-binding transcriptional MerR regulator
MNEQKQIGEVARELGINPKTIRYYEEIGLIPTAQRTETGYRVYDQADIDRLAFILRARALDFSLDGIGEILALRENGEAPCLYVTELVQQQIAAIEDKIAVLTQLRHELEEIDRTAQALPRESIANKECICHLIENQALTSRRK